MRLGTCLGKQLGLCRARLAELLGIDTKTLKVAPSQQFDLKDSQGRSEPHSHKSNPPPHSQAAEHAQQLLADSNSLDSPYYCNDFFAVGAPMLGDRCPDPPSACGGRPNCSDRSALPGDWRIIIPPPPPPPPFCCSSPSASPSAAACGSTCAIQRPHTVTQGQTCVCKDIHVRTFAPPWLS
jgi:hypothetical protein